MRRITPGLVPALSSSLLAFATGIIALLAFAAGPGTARAEEDILFVVGQSAEVRADQQVEAAIVIGGDLTVAGRVEEAAVAVGGDLRVLPGARIDGTATAVGGALAIDGNAQVTGPRVQVAGGDFSQVAAKLAEAEGAHYEAPPMWIGPVVRMFQVLGLFVVGLFLVLLAPRPVRIVGQTLRERPAQVSLAGLGLLLGFVPLCIVLGISLIGIPLIPVAVLGLLAMFIMGLTAMAIDVGRKVPVVKGEDNLLGALTAGLLILLVVAVVPVLGGLVLFFASFYAAGGVMLSRFGTLAPPDDPAASALQPQPHEASVNPR